MRVFIIAEEAAALLFGDQLDDPDFDPRVAQFESGADVAEGLASLFGFTDEDYARIARERQEVMA